VNIQKHIFKILLAISSHGHGQGRTQVPLVVDQVDLVLGIGAADLWSVGFCPLMPNKLNNCQ